MSEDQKKKESGKIKDRISGAGKTRKKLVIKKKPGGQKKDISEAYRGGRKKVVARKPTPRPPQPSVGAGATTSRPRVRENREHREPGAEGPISKALRGLQPRPGSGISREEGGTPPQETRRPVRPQPTLRKATPFDAAIQEASHTRRPYQGNNPRSPGGPNRGGPGGSGPGGSGPGRGGSSGPGQGRGGPGGGFGGGGPRGPGGFGGGPGGPGGGGGPGGPGGGPGRGPGGPGGGRGGYRGGGGGRGGYRDDKSRSKENRKFFEQQAERKRQAAVDSVPKNIEIIESIQVGDLARKLNLKPSEVIGKLMRMGEMVTINKTIDAETATLVASEYNCEVKVVSLYDETVIKEELDKEDDRIKRPPVVTIMGHVDHGKTRLLDTVRSSNVIDSEAGAITQHIGAYQVKTPKGAITFLDTPGHEAFTAMRARGAAVTDIVILVVAADDGVKQQTKEAIHHAKEANVPIIVAVNKIDLPAADIKRVKTELGAEGLQADDFGGDVTFCEISAKENIGIDHLLEMIVLQTDMMNLTANPEVRAQGRVIEARIDPGKGPVATVLIEKGTLREGDPYVAGTFSGRVRAMYDDFGRRVKEAGPSFPAEVIGIDGVPGAGDPFTSVENEKYGREVASKRQHYQQITESASRARAQPSLGDLSNWVQDHKELKVIIKADVQGSVEAISDGLAKLSTEDVKVRVIHGATGAITETDVNLALASEALIIAFHVRASGRPLDLAEQNNVQIKPYSIIYDIIDDVRDAMEGLLEPDRVEETTGQAEIREIFKISRLGNVAGCMMLSGKIYKRNPVRVKRGEDVIFDGNLKAIKRHKEDVLEVTEGYECGFSIDGFNDITKGDIIEGYSVKEIARKL